MVNNDVHCPLSIVECLDKRRKLSIQELERFQDELLVEVLCRLPNSKDVIQCKSVCKRWSALISEPYFLNQFIDEKIRKSTLSSFIIVARTHSSHETWTGLMMHLDNPVFNLRKFTPSTLPGVSGAIVGAHNDLLLYCEDASNRYCYSIYNIQTRQQISLPPTPFYYRFYVNTAFFCESYYTFDKSGKVICNEAYRFSIVVVDQSELRQRTHIASKDRHTIQVFSSNSSSQLWTTKVLLLPRSCRLMAFDNRSFTFDGKLHIRSIEGLIGFDPCTVLQSSDVIRGHVISWPPGNIYNSSYVCVHQGKVRLYKFDDERVLMTWVLKDYERGEWSLLHTIAPHQWVRRGKFASQQHDLRWLGPVAGKHPSNPNIIYLSCPGWRTVRSILICNTSTRRVSLAFRLPKLTMLSCLFISYSLALPVWPTPLPTLSNSIKRPSYASDDQ